MLNSKKINLEKINKIKIFKITKKINHLKKLTMKRCLFNKQINTNKLIY